MLPHTLEKKHYNSRYGTLVLWLPLTYHIDVNINVINSSTFLIFITQIAPL